ncbi:lipopolysaccharide biosynthesis protein [Shewanella sp. MF05960]|uniref:lipopolysaccharide biosynthesis protein n=1 Tax=Shewanella sp. MF05960 TaxID=3434874 RepID=UPI003D7BB8AB
MNNNKLLSFSVGPIIAALLTLITLPLISWFFTPEDIGRYSILQATTACAALFLTMGLDQAYVRYFYADIDRSMLLKSTFFPGIFIFLLFFFLWMISGLEFSNILFSVNGTSFDFLLIVCVFFVFGNSVLTLLLRMHGLGWAFSLSQVIPKLVLLLMLVFIYLFHIDFDFLILITLYTISIGSAFVFFVLFNREHIIDAFKAKLDLVQLIELYRFGFPLFGATLSYWMLTSIDRFFIKNLSTLEELAIYSIATSFASVVVIFIAIFGNLWHPTVYRWHADNVSFDWFKLVIDFISILVVVIWTLFGISSSLLVNFVPATYSSIEYIIIGCAAAPLFYLLSESTVIGIGISKKTGYSFLAGFISLMINLVLNYIFVPQLGAVGAAFSSMISFYIFFILRTEFSVMLWKSFSRLKLYIITSAYLLLSIAHILLYKFNYTTNAIYLTFFWMLLMCISLFTYKRSIKSMYELYREYKRVK